MNRSRMVIKALGLSGLVIGLTMLVAILAHAEPTANWVVNGANIANNTLLPEAQVKELESKDGVLLFTTKFGTSVEVLCTAVALTNVKLKTQGSTTEGSATFSGCIVKLFKTLSEACKPSAGGQKKGVIKTLNLLGLIVLSSGSPIVLFAPETGTLIAQIELGEDCSIGESIPVTGEVTFKDSSFKTSAVDHLFIEGPITGTNLLALGQQATLDFGAVATLAGAHAGLKWSGSPG